MLSFITLCLIIHICGGENVGTHIIGYDCSGTSGQISAVSLNSIRNCETPQDQVKKTQLHIQVLQQKLYTPVKVYSCLLEITRYVKYCSGVGLVVGSWSSRQASVRSDGFSYVNPLGKIACRDIHDTGIFNFQGKVIDTHVKPNSSNSYTHVMSGEMDGHGGCVNGKEYRDAGTNVHNKLVYGTLKLTIRDMTGIVSDNGENIKIQETGLTCSHKHQYCLDSFMGELIWEYRDIEMCSPYGVDVLYEGSGEVLEGIGGQRERFIKVSTQGHAFALELTEQAMRCTRAVWKTTQPRLEIMPVEAGESPFRKIPIMTQNLDLTAYINSKFMLTQTNAAMNALSLYNTLRLGICQNRKLVLENRLALAKLNPNEVSRLLDDNQGVYGRVMGEVLYIVKCTPILTSHRQTTECYQELPVLTANGTKGFLMPVTRIFTYIGTVVTCSHMIPPMFKLDKYWVSRDPIIRTAIPPKELDPNDEDFSWTYETIPGFSMAGLYSSNDMEKLQREMMFPSSREAVSNNIASRVIDEEGKLLTYMNLLNNDDIDSLTSQVGAKLSWIFELLGRWASIFVGIYMIWKILLYAIDVLINCFVLKREGVPFYMRMAGITATLTNLITIHKKYFAAKNPSSPLPLLALPPPSAPEEETLGPACVVEEDEPQSPTTYPTTSFQAHNDPFVYRRQVL